MLLQPLAEHSILLLLLLLRRFSLSLLTKARASIRIALVVREILRLLGALVFGIALCLIFYFCYWLFALPIVVAVTWFIFGCTHHGARVCTLNRIVTRCLFTILGEVLCRQSR